MKRSLFVFVMMVAALAPMFAAGSSEAAGDKELIINSYMSDEKPKAVFQSVVDSFQKANPDIKVTVNTIAHEQYKTQLASWLTSSSAPDVVTWFAGYRMQAFAEKGLLEPIDTVFPGGEMTKEFPAAFKVASSWKGKVYFMPQSWYWWAVYYNKDVFAKYKLTPPKTWDEFMKVCETLKANGVAPIAVGAKDTWTTGGWFDLLDSAVNGGDFHAQLTSGNVAYTDPKVKKSLGIIAELAQKGYFIDNATSMSWQESVKPLAEGKAGMYLMGQFIMDTVPAETRGSIDFFPFPIYGGNTKYTVDTPTDGLMIPAKAKNKDAAKKFLAFLATKEQQEAFCAPLGRLAANVNVAAPNAEAVRGLAMVKGAAYAAQFYDRDAPEEMAAKGLNAILDIMSDPARLDAILADLDKERIRIYEK